MSASGNIGKAVDEVAAKITAYTASMPAEAFTVFAARATGYSRKQLAVFAEENDKHPALERYYDVLGQLMMQALLKAAMDMRHFHDGPVQRTVEARLADAHAARRAKGNMYYEQKGF